MSFNMDNREFEKRLNSEGFNYIAGCDEVGRGCIAGPVYACAIIMPNDSNIEGVTDSKKLTDKKRRNLKEKILKEAVSYAVVAISNEEIDRINILEASRKAMEEALKKLHVKPDYILTDAMKIHTEIPYESIIKGDERSYTIGCASIVAKVIRDDLMTELAKEYPGYDWEKNKGYPTPFHKKQLSVLGVTKHHRLTYEPVRACLELTNKS
jgi:ribonuclease HII